MYEKRDVDAPSVDGGKSLMSAAALRPGESGALSRCRAYEDPTTGTYLNTGTGVAIVILDSSGEHLSIET
jgi:hypothetical protein